MRVVSTVKSWLENYYDDFAEDESLQVALKDFVTKMVPTVGAPAAQLLSTLQKRQEQTPPVSSDAPASPSSLVDLQLSWETVDELEVARQICLLEFKIYSSILAKETLNLNWSKHKERSPNVLALIEQFNRVRFSLSLPFPFHSPPFLIFTRVDVALGDNHDCQAAEIVGESHSVEQIHHPCSSSI